jgi:hypothetical protein
VRRRSCATAAGAITGAPDGGAGDPGAGCNHARLCQFVSERSRRGLCEAPPTPEGSMTRQEPWLSAPGIARGRARSRCRPRRSPPARAGSVRAAGACPRERMLGAAGSAIGAVHHVPGVAKAAFRVDERVDELLPVSVLQAGLLKTLESREVGLLNCSSPRLMDAHWTHHASPCASRDREPRQKPAVSSGFVESPLPDSNRRPLPYHGHASV